MRAARGKRQLLFTQRDNGQKRFSSFGEAPIFHPACRPSMASSSRRPQQPGDHLALETKKKECVGLRPFSADDCHCHQRGDNWHRLDPSGGCRSPLSVRLQTRLGECDNRNNHSLPRLPGNSETSFVSTVDRCNGFLRGERETATSTCLVSFISVTCH